jgi:hypothetical protein
MRPDLLGDPAAGADRNADDDEIGALDRGGVGLHHLIGEAELGHALARLRRARGRDDRARQFCSLAARAIEEPISPTPISASRLKQRLAHASRPMNSRSACTTRRLASRCRPSCAARSAACRR